MNTKFITLTKSEICKVDIDVLGSLKNAAKLMERGRRLFRWGAGNQLYPLLGSYGQSFVAWTVSKKCEHMFKSLGPQAIKYKNMIVKNATKGKARDKVTMQSMAEDHVKGIMMSYGSHGGNCMENAEYMAYAIIRKKGLGNGYTQLKRIYIPPGTDHEIVMVSHESMDEKMRPSIMIDAWIPAAQACLAKHSLWGADNEPSWSLDLTKTEIQLFDYDKLTSELKQKVRIRKGEIKRLWQNYASDPGESCEVRYECEKCKRKWGGETVEKLTKEVCPFCKKTKLESPKCFSNRNKSGFYRCGGDGPPFKTPAEEITARRCPICGDKVKTLIPDMRMKYPRKYYLPPYLELGKKDEINYEASINISLNNYENCGIVEGSDVDHSNEEIIIKQIPYRVEFNETRSSKNYVDWMKHYKKMREYIWGTIFDEKTYKYVKQKRVRQKP